MTIIDVNLRVMTVKEADILVSDNVRTYFVEFSFSKDWDDFSKVAVFQSVGGVPVEMTLQTNMIHIPWEVLEMPNREVAVGVYGVNANGDILSSMPVVFGTVNQGTDVDNEPYKEFTPDLIDQLLEWIAQDGGGGGVPGPQGPPGTDGTTFIPSISYDGVISWTNNGGLENPEPVSVMGPEGVSGADGIDATINGMNTLSIVAGQNIVIDQEGSILTISATEGGSVDNPSDYVTEDRVEEIVAEALVNVPSSTTVKNITVMTEAEYAALTDKESTTLYVILEEG